MKIVVAPDSFKGSLNSVEAAAAMARGVRAAAPGADVVESPLADGGAGSLDALLAATGARLMTATVRDPLGRPVEARFAMLPGDVAFVEMAEASGLNRLSAEERDPRKTCSRGTGELIRAAAAQGARRIRIGLGGSATNDAGAGLLREFGLQILDSGSRPVPPGGAGLALAARLDLTAWRPPDLPIELLSDVKNPLTGSSGASAVYGPQKGADPQTVAELDAALAHFACLAEAALGDSYSVRQGAGAAGGCGFALLGFFRATLQSGARAFLELSRFRELLTGADLLLTGEGQIDWQSIEWGKTVGEAAAAASAANVPVLALCGGIGERLGDYRRAGIDGVASILPRPMSLQAAMASADQLLEDAARRLIEVYMTGFKKR